MRWTAHDTLRNVVELSDPAGALVETRTFDPFGNQQAVFNAANSSRERYGFTGHEHDPETNLIYAKARYYDADLGVFNGTRRDKTNHGNPIRQTNHQPKGHDA